MSEACRLRFRRRRRRHCSRLPDVDARVFKRPSSRNRSRKGKESASRIRQRHPGSSGSADNYRSFVVGRRHIVPAPAAVHPQRSSIVRLTCWKVFRWPAIVSLPCWPTDRHRTGDGSDGLALNEGTYVGGCSCSSCRKGVSERVLPDTMLFSTPAYDVLSHARYLSPQIKPSIRYTVIRYWIINMR